MKKLDISISKAQLMGFDVKLEDGMPVVSASIALMTEGGKIITSYSAGTEKWRSDPLDLSVNALPLIGDLARMLEGAVVRHCRDSQMALPAPAPKDEHKVDFEKHVSNDPNDNDAVVADISNEPINLDDIPF